MPTLSFQKAIQPIRDWFLDLALPKECIGKCGSDSSYFCIDCLWKVNLAGTQACPSCNVKNFWGTVCNTDTCLNSSRINQLLVVCDYHQNRQISEAIHIFKYRFAQELGHNLAVLMVKKFWHFFSTNRIVFVPVPLHQKRLMFRGFNQAEVLAHHLSALTGHPSMELLKRIKYSKPQAELDGAQRRKNLKEAFQINIMPPTNATIVLVDDVFTTGSTLNECAKTLKSNGVEWITALTLARSSPGS